MKLPTLLLSGTGLCALCFTRTPAIGQGAVFTYQGRLNTNGVAVSGAYDFRFRLASDALGNNLVGSAFLINGIAVNNGLFTATLDFGLGVFTGSNYWLEVDVRTNGGSSYTALAPLQALTPAPYAIFANTASNLSGTVSSANIAGTYGNPVILNNPNNSFSGTFTGNGANVTNVNARTLGGLLANGFWQLGGNGIAGGQFLGSTNNQPVELLVNGQRALRLEPTTNISAVNVIGGSSANGVDAGVVGATIGGGGTTNYNGVPFPNRVGGSYGTIGGGASNNIAAGSTYTTIAGGGGNAIQSGLSGTIGGGVFNLILETDSVIAGGNANSILPGANTSVIGGGYGNTIQTNASYSTLGGGTQNTIQTNAFYSVIAGGAGNVIRSNANVSVISGGLDNIASGQGATVAGGQQNIAAGNYSFAAGRYANAANDGSFVWADISGFAPFASTGTNQFCVRAHGGLQLDPLTSIFFGAQTRQMVNLYSNSVTTYAIGVQNADMYFRCGADVPGTGFAWYRGGQHNDSPFNGGGGTNLMTLTTAGLTVNGAFVSSSDRNAKENFEAVSAEDILAKVTALPICRWSFSQDPGARHIGPMAQDFYGAFGVGPDDKHIATVDEGGVALAAIQGLNRKLEKERREKDAEIEQLKRSVAQLQGLVERLAAQHDAETR